MHRTDCNMQAVFCSRTSRFVPEIFAIKLRICPKLGPNLLFWVPNGSLDLSPESFHGWLVSLRGLHVMSIGLCNTRRAGGQITVILGFQWILNLHKCWVWFSMRTLMLCECLYGCEAMMPMMIAIIYATADEAVAYMFYRCFFLFCFFFCFFSVRQKYETTVLGNGWTDFHETFTKRYRGKWSLQRRAAAWRMTQN